MIVPAVSFAAIVLSLLYFANKSSNEPENEPNQTKNQPQNQPETRPRSPPSLCNFSAKTDQILENKVLTEIQDRVNEGRVNADIVSDVLSKFENVSQMGVLRTTSLKDILQCRADARIKAPVQVKIVEGFNAFDFGKGKFEYINNSMVQVASQFNFLESTKDQHMDLKWYASDLTQGPQASLGCPGMLAQRNAIFKNESDLNTQPFFGGLREAYKRGYFTPSKIKIRDRHAALEYVSSNWEKLRVLVQSGKTVFGSDTTQVFMAAPSFQNEGIPKDEELREMCRIIVGHQYEALGVLAALQNKATDSLVNLHVTLVGQGAFYNPPEVLRDSFSMLLKALKGHDVRVHVHAYSPRDVNNVVEALSGSLTSNEVAKIERITQQQFLRR